MTNCWPYSRWLDLHTDLMNFFKKIMSRSIGTDKGLLRKSVLNSWGTTDVPYHPEQKTRMKGKVAEEGKDSKD